MKWLGQDMPCPKTTAWQPPLEQPPLRNNRVGRVASSNHSIFLGAGAAAYAVSVRDSHENTPSPCGMNAHAKLTTLMMVVGAAVSLKAN